MKYIVLWESKLEYMDKVIAKANNIPLEREKDPDKYALPRAYNARLCVV